MEDTSWIKNLMELAQTIVNSPALPAVISGIIGYWAMNLVSEFVDRKGINVGVSAMRGAAFLICYALFMVACRLMGISFQGVNAAYGFLGGAISIGYFHGKRMVERLKE